MHSIEIPEANKSLSFPEDGTEFNRSQFISLSRLMLYFNAKMISFSVLKTQLVYAFLNMVRSADLSKPENEQVTENLFYLTKLTDPYFYEEKIENKKVKALHMNFYRQLIPSINVNKTVFYGPSDALFNTKYGEYMQAANCFVDYSHSSDENDLDRLVATLYRPEKTNNRPENQNYSADKRQEFNPELTNSYAAKIKNIRPEIKHAIYLYFASCQHFIANSTELPIGGGATADLSVLFKKSTGSSNKGVGMISTFYAIAEAKVFGAAKDVAEQRTYDVLVYLVDQNLKMEEQKRKSKRKKK